jgi:hypothetical protein
MVVTVPIHSLRVQKEYERNLDYEGFASSPEAAAAEDLLETYRTNIKVYGQ